MNITLKKTVLIACALVPLFSVAKPLPEQAQLAVKLQLPSITSGVYARPYVAVWIENEQREAIRTVQLWVGKDEWLKDLRSWWRKAGRYDRNMVDALTGATRPAGEYRFSWDGKDQQGKTVAQGNYTFSVEVVREHGGRNLVRKKITLAEQDFDVRIKATQETGIINLIYKSGK
ncbi:MAG: DUF2271 domain-containing protein [Psychromonas sp.]|nr:DUF2271 domain-containing protein [Alteromonadales bacterium]MCP5078690.1 DUF2271 domain-containing protein [Psychromonas sp.]